MSCKYNKTTIETYAKAFDLSARKLQKLWDRLICNVTAISESAERIYQDYQKKNCKATNLSSPFFFVADTRAHRYWSKPIRYLQSYI